MPVLYAHYRFGYEAARRFPPMAQETLRRNSAYFDLGLQGPDLLYFYALLRKNPVKKQGYGLHLRSGSEFFTDAVNVCHAAENRDAAQAYCMGLLCHYALDRCCHPTVEIFVSQGIPHAKTEASFDRFLLNLDHRLSMPTEVLAPNADLCEVIAPFYPPLSAKAILRCQKGLARYARITCLRGAKRRLLLSTMCLCGKRKLTHHMIPPVSDLCCSKTDQALMDCYGQALDLTDHLLPKFLDHFYNNVPLDGDFARTFSVL